MPSVGREVGRRLRIRLHVPAGGMAYGRMAKRFSPRDGSLFTEPDSNGFKKARNIRSAVRMLMSLWGGGGGGTLA